MLCGKLESKDFSLLNLTASLEFNWLHHYNLMSLAGFMHD